MKRQGTLIASLTCIGLLLGASAYTHGGFRTLMYAALSAPLQTKPSTCSEGWYITGTWAVAGRGALRAAEAGRHLGGFKGVELATRVERLSFGSGSGAQATLRNPRSSVASIDEHAWTFGINWSLNRWSRIQLNAIREQVTDAIRAAAASPEASWTQIIRIQLAM